MHHIDKTTVSGCVEHVIAHCFTVKTAVDFILADLKPHGARHVPNGDCGPCWQVGWAGGLNSLP